MKSDVYFAKVPAGKPKERVPALGNLLRRADPFSSCAKGEIVPVKLTGAIFKPRL